MNNPALDATDRKIINSLQGTFPVCEKPFTVAADRLGLSENDLIERIADLVADGVLSRFGPMYNAERLGGAVTLCAMIVPEDRYETVAEQVNAHREVAHNYARAHTLNMWFVLATETREQIDTALARIERDTGLKVYNFPKQHEFFIGLKVPA